MRIRIPWKKIASLYPFRLINFNPSVRPVGRYPSSIVDSQACEFGFEIYYHIPYAYHLHRMGLLTKTISCRDTRQFYWFSPEHIEAYERRKVILEFPSIGQIAFQPLAFDRWEAPDFYQRYANVVCFGFAKPLLLVFNKYNSEWDGPPINFLSKELLISIAQRVRGRYQMVYCRPTSKIVLDNSQLLDLDEKQRLQDHGVVMAETLHDSYSHLSFNEFQLCLLASSRLRISVQGGATYLNSLFPGRLFVLHRRGKELEANTYQHLERLGVDELNVFDDEQLLWIGVQSAMFAEESDHRMCG